MSSTGELQSPPRRFSTRTIVQTQRQVAAGAAASHGGDHRHGTSSSSFKSLFAGAVGGTLEVLTDHPIDLIKVRMQTSSHSSSSSSSASVTSILSQVVHQEGAGPLGLYRGASIRVATLMPATAISFWGLDVGKKLVRQWNDYSSLRRQEQQTNDLTVLQVCWAGAFSGLPVTLFATPSERIKCLLQTQPSSVVQLSSVSGPFLNNGIQNSTYYKGPIDCARQIYHAEGISGLYRGLGITLCRNIPGYAVWFGTYELVKRQILSWQQQKQQGRIDKLQQQQQLSFTAIVLAGGLAGSLSWAVMIPFDGIKSIVQTSPTPISIGTAYRQLLMKSNPNANNSRGILSALLRGMRPAVLIAFPANAACFVGMEVAWKALSILD